MSSLSIKSQAGQSKLKARLALGLLLGVTLLGLLESPEAQTGVSRIRIRGEVKKHPTLGESKPTAAVFVIARRMNSKMPLAVQRIANPKFPVSFDLGPEHIMVPGQKLEGEVTVEAKLTQRGDAVSKPGDWVMLKPTARLNLSSEPKKLVLELGTIHNDQRPTDEKKDAK